MGQPAVFWADQVTWARKCQAQAESFARAIGDAVTDPKDPYAAELRRSRHRAALEEVTKTVAAGVVASTEVAAQLAGQPPSGTHKAEQPKGG